MKIEQLNSQTFKWGEGPVWWNDQFYAVDISGKALVRYCPVTQENKVWQVDQRIGFALPCEDGRWIWGGDEGLFFIDLETGISSPIINPESDIEDNRFNDAGVSPDGRLFAGSIATTKIVGNASLYRFDEDLSCHKVFSNVTNSNGIAWSPDAKTCFYIDTPSYNIRSFAYDPESGAISNEQILFNSEEMIKGVPDGMCTDVDGNLWIAFCHGGCVVKFEPSGTLLERINFPCIETTSCCFGGPELTDLYVTTGISPTLTEPQAGKTFIIRNAGKGIPQVPFKTAKQKPSTD
ncbi:SMP-30/gluconolactonase/LRE family protein [Kiritimatiellaeota bacterium B1221]|nr:SMP-30/gluconolactonase/LRE family protein [Kiritimatiellaeota bacterium B1221]